MKRLLIAAAAIVAAANMYAQGTINPSTVGCCGGFAFQLEGAAGGVANADGIMAQIYWAPVGTANFSPAGSPYRVGAALAGNVAGAAFGITGADPGAMVVVQYRSWEAAFGGTYEAAVANQTPMGNRLSYRGVSNDLMVTLGGAGSPPSTPPSLVAAGIQRTVLTAPIIPEPSVIALGALGAGALLLLRRRSK